MAKILFIVHWDWVFQQLFRPIILSLHRAGHEVVIVCPRGKYVADFEREGVRFVDWPVKRRSTNPFGEIGCVRRLRRIIEAEKPDLVHAITIKPSFYTSLAIAYGYRGRARRPHLINFFTGLGYLFSDAPGGARLRTLVMPLVRHALRKSGAWVVLWNQDNLETWLRMKVTPPERTVVFISSGVDVRRFHPPAVPTRRSIPVVITVARLLRDKGIVELVEAATKLRARGVAAEFWLVGEPDLGNPTSLTAAEVQGWHDEGLVRWLGHRTDVPDLLRQADIAALPSYHEGLGLVLVEASATGLPVVATRVSGCTLAVDEGVNGFLVPPRDSAALADALERLILNPELRTRLGQAGRTMAVERFSEEAALSRYFDFCARIGAIEQSPAFASPQSSIAGLPRS